jgi:hypothetical protein
MSSITTKGFFKWEICLQQASAQRDHLQVIDLSKLQEVLLVNEWFMLKWNLSFTINQFILQGQLVHINIIVL